MSLCTSEIDELDQHNVMNCQVGPTFQRPQSLLQSCQATLNPFQTFCLYPPIDERMVVMCSGDPESLFASMTDSQLVRLSEVPRVISYPRISDSATDYFVETNVWPGVSLPHIPRLSSFAVSNELNHNLAMLHSANADVLFQFDDGIMRRLPSPTGQSDSFQKCLVSADGAVQLVMYTTTGVFVSLSNSPVFMRLPLPLVGGSVLCMNMFIWDIPGDNSRIGIGVNFMHLVNASVTRFGVCLFSISKTTTNLSLAFAFKVCFVEFSLPNTIPTWCVPSTDNSVVLFAIAINGSPQVYEIYYTSLTNNGNPTPILFGRVFVPQAFSPVLQSWSSILPNNLASGGSVMCRRADNLVLTFVIPAGFPFVNPVAGTQVSDPNIVQIAQSASTNLVLRTTQLLVNNVVVTTPFALDPTDVYAITPSGNSVVVISSDGHYYVFDTVTFLWINNVPSLDLFLGSGQIKLDELQDGTFKAWFLGTSLLDFPQQPFEEFPVDIGVSRHQVVKIVAKGISVNRRLVAVISKVNVFALVTDANNVTRLYDDGNIRVLQGSQVIWESMTSDQEGSDDLFAVLDLVNPSTAPETLHAVSSQNGVYMLLVLDNSVDLVFNPFNVPRFTKWATIDTNNLQNAADAQSLFCFRALNNQSQDKLKFLDKRCSCLTSERMAKRVYPSISNLDQGTQLLLQDQTPCILKDCQDILNQDQFTIARLAMGNKCKEGVGICSSFASTAMPGVFFTQDCTSGLQNCTLTSQCPLGSQCQNGVCVLTCTSDAICQKANINALCIKNQCVVQQTSNSSKKKLSLFTTVMICIAVGTFIFVFFFLFLYWCVR